MAAKGKGKEKGKDKGKDKGKEKGKKKGGKGKDESGKGANTSTELHGAARAGDLAKLDELLADEEKVKELNQADQHKRTPLHMAAFFGKADAVAKLLEKSASPMLEAMDGFLPLHFAAQAGHLEVLRLLVRKVGSKGEFGEVKKHVNRVVHKGKKSALHLALLKGHSECAKFLALKGASLDAKTAQGQTPLDLCQDEALKEELAGKAKAHKEEAAKDEEAAKEAQGDKPAEETAKDEEATKDAAGGKTAEDAEMGEAGVKPKEAAQPAQEASGEPPAKRRAVGEAGSQTAAVESDSAGLPAAPAAADGSGSGAAPSSWPLGDVTVEVAEDKAYPEGTLQKADDEWELKMEEEPEMKDAPVWCLLAAESGPQLKLKLQKSSQKLLHYTHFSDEAGKLDKDARCNACGLTVLTETSDGQLMLERAASESWNPVPGTSTLSSSVLSEALQQALQPFARLRSVEAALESVRILGVVDAEEATADGHRHTLVASCKLPKSALEVEPFFTAGAVDKALAFAALPGHEAAEDVTQVSFEELLKKEPALMPEMQRRAVSLLRGPHIKPKA